MKQGLKVLADSGDLYNTQITGGRLGMIVFGQQNVIWSGLDVRCSDRRVQINSFTIFAIIVFDISVFEGFRRV